MKQIQSQLAHLYDEWKSCMDEDQNLPKPICFTETGIMNMEGKEDEDWLNLPVRVAYLLKDQNQSADISQRHNDNTASFKNGIRTWRGFFSNIARIFYGLYKTVNDSYCSWEEVKSKTKEVREFFLNTPIALIETKKQPGGPSVNSDEFLYHLTEHIHFLMKEINIIRPNFIICSCQEIYENVISHYGEIECYKKKNANNLVTFTDHGCVTYDLENGVFIIRVNHPSRMLSAKEHYEFAVTRHFAEVLKLIRNQGLEIK